MKSKEGRGKRMADPGVELATPKKRVEPRLHSGTVPFVDQRLSRYLLSAWNRYATTPLKCSSSC
jgi:hypothetical protein